MPDKELTRAGFGPRAAAYIIDRALLLIALVIVRAPAALVSAFGAGRLTDTNFIFNHSMVDVICWLLTSAYFVLLTWFCGATLGKMVMRLQVRREDDGPMRFIDILYRETVGRFLSGILCIGYLMVLGDKKKHAFHDWLCGTCVVYDGVHIPEKEKAPAAVPQVWSEPGAPVRSLPDAEAEDAAPAAPSWSLPGAHPADPAPEASVFPEEEDGA